MEMFDGRNTFRSALSVPTGRRLKWIVVAIAVVASALLLAGGVEAKTASGPAAGLPDGAQSAEAARLIDELQQGQVAPALVVFDRRGEALSTADRAAIQSLASRLEPYADGAALSPPVPAEDGKATILAVPLPGGSSDDQIRQAVEGIRSTAGSGLPDGLRVQVTGGPAFDVDLAKVFDGADLTLLLTTIAVVALLLLLTYRSPWLWLVPLAVVGVADQVAARLLSVASNVFGFPVDEAVAGITSVLVFGAGTNYALLLIARYREELRKAEDRHVAMRKALREAAAAILASSSTVILALLSLSFASSPFSRTLGYAGAIGIGTAVVYALVVLPATLLLFGRRLFWPFVPRLGQDEPTRRGVWAKVGRVVTRRPAPVIAVSVALLGVLAIGLTGLTTGLSRTEQFRAEPESVTGQQVLAEHFPAGSSEPTTIITSPDRVAAVSAAAQQVDGVASVRRGTQKGELASVDVTLTGGPASDAAFEQVRGLRSAVVSADPDALVGGPDAQALDSNDAAAHDRRIVGPLVLGIVLVILLVLLRSIVASVLLVLTVVATYVASMGASWFAFTHWFGFPALDLDVPLLSFLFLVALGVDYNIFLATRAKEEAQTASTRDSIAVALAVTGGVITSAGILLAAVFTVLGVLPLITLTQIGIIVGFGVLLDTLVVRSLLVPALVAAIGRRFWWPGPLSRATPDNHPASPKPVTETPATSTAGR